MVHTGLRVCCLSEHSFPKEVGFLVDQLETGGRDSESIVERKVQERIDLKVALRLAEHCMEIDPEGSLVQVDRMIALGMKRWASTGLLSKTAFDGKPVVVHLLAVKSYEEEQGPSAVEEVALALLCYHMVPLAEAWRDFAD